MTEQTDERRLPPPAFPSGQRPPAVPAGHEESGSGGAGGARLEVEEMIAAVRAIADDLARDGEAALHGAADAGPLDAALRACCMGYLAGRRASETPGAGADGRA